MRDASNYIAQNDNQQRILENLRRSPDCIRCGLSHYRIITCRQAVKLALSIVVQAGTKMIVDLGDRKLIIKFKHSDGVQFLSNGDTICYIIQIGEYMPRALGTAVCSINDIFNREIGRKIALTRALKNLNREERTIIWKTYHGRKGKK